MRFFKEVGGFIFEFDSIGGFINFTIGRIIGVIVFILLIIGWYLCLYWMGYIESIDPLLRVIHVFI
jgi:hypothetical protein